MLNINIYVISVYYLFSKHISELKFLKNLEVINLFNFIKSKYIIMYYVKYIFIFIYIYIFEYM